MNKVFLFLVGCVALATAGCDKPAQSLTLAPIATETLVQGDHDESDWACFPVACFPSHGIGCFPAALSPGGVQVGFDWHYDSGTPPCNCWWWVDCAFRGGVRFDLTSLSQSLVNPAGPKNVVTAMLKWEYKGSCATRLHVPQSGFGTFSSSSPEQQLTSDPGAGQTGVTDFVKNVVLGGEEFISFVFLGSDESFPEDTNDSCTTEVTGFTLDVVYTD